MASARVIGGDCLDMLCVLDSRTVQTCVTSPPYWGLRDYGTEGQLGLEPTPEQYVANIVTAFREVRRVLRNDGTLWLNLGDSYCNTDKWGGGVGGNTGKHTTNGDDVPSWAVRRKREPIPGLKPKDLVGIPWMVAFALRADGWYLRSDIIWAKPNPMPESVTDRPTKAHEYLFLLSKSARYFYDAEAVREPHANPEWTAKALEGNWRRSATNKNAPERNDGASVAEGVPYADRINPNGRNKRSVWTVSTQPFPGAHFATFPPKLIEPCILAGSRPGDTVLDPFNGAGTTGVVALRHDRDYIGIELNPEYAQMSRHRIADDAPLLNEVAA